MSVAGKTVTIQLNADNYNKPLFKEGDRVNVPENAWWLPKQRIKNKMMVHRLLKKKFYYPFFKVSSINNGEGEITLTMKPINF